MHCHEFLNSWSKLRSLFAMSGQNDHFTPKWFEVVMWHINRKRMSLIFQKNPFLWKKLLLGATSGKNQFFWKILWWRHNHIKWPKLTKNIRIQLIQWNLYHKKQNQYAYGILKSESKEFLGYFYVEFLVFTRR